MKKFLAILLALCMTFALFACSKDEKDNTQGGGQSAGSSAKDTLTVAITQDRGTLDPMYVLGYDILDALSLIYEPLWDFDSKGEFVWRLATALDYIEPTKWHITLREGVKFQNGNPFDAEDALFSVLRGNQRAGEPPFLPELDIDNCKVVDKNKIELNFHKYDISYIYGMNSLMMFDVESFVEADVAEHPNGTGPYVLDEYVVNSHLNLKLRDDYWGTKPAIAKMNFRVLVEDTQRVNALQTDAADYSELPTQDVEFVKTLDGITVDVRSTAMQRALYFNLAPTSIFHDNLDARLAVAYAIDREAVVDIAYSGFASIARFASSVGNIDVDSSYYDLGVYGVGYNVELAKEYAEKAGLVGKEIKIIDNGSAADVVTAELIQSNLKEIGITVNIFNLDPGSWTTVLFDDSQYDMAIDFVTAPSMTLAQNYYAWVTYGGGGSYTRNPWPGDARFLSLIENLMSMSDVAERNAVIKELNSTLSDSVLWYGLVDMQRAYGYNSQLGGYQRMFMGGLDYRSLYWK